MTGRALAGASARCTLRPSRSRFQPIGRLGAGTPAVGVRTFPIVGMSSCAVLLIVGADAAAQSRVLQGLLTGIGFVGAGAIVKDGQAVHGTATAASIWTTGAIGAAVALERYEIGIALMTMNLLTLRLLLPIKQRLDKVDQ